MPGKRRNIYDIIRFGMVLVAADCSNTGNFYPFQNQVYEMVGQTSAGKEKQPAWKMGG